MKAGKRTIIISIIITVLINLIIWLIFNYNPKESLCEGNIKIEKKYKNYLKENGLLDTICSYEYKILKLNEFNYLNKIIDHKESNYPYLKESVMLYTNLILESNRNEFVQYFNTLLYKEKFKIISFLKLVNNKESGELLKVLAPSYEQNEKKY